jgi:hypothetical protein
MSIQQLTRLLPVGFELYMTTMFVIMDKHMIRRSEVFTTSVLKIHNLLEYYAVERSIPEDQNPKDQESNISSVFQ